MSNTTDAIADMTTYGKWLPAYRGVFASNTNIADAMGYTALPADLKEAIWDAFEAAEANGGVADIGNPADMTADQHAAGGADGAVDLTWAEARTSYAAKVAHAFYLQVHHVFPWGILGLDLISCRGLFDPTYLYYNWTASTSAECQRLVDHSPSRAHAEATSILSSPRNPLHALSQLIYAGSTFAHYSTSTTLAGWSPLRQSLNALTMDQVRVPGTASTGNHYSSTNTAWISRGGCHFMGQWIPALCRSVNIPAIENHGWWGADESDAETRPGAALAHHSCWFPSFKKRPPFGYGDQADSLTDKGLILLHGDHPYNMSGFGGTQESRALRRLGNYSAYKAYAEGEDWDVRREFTDRTDAFFHQRHPDDYLYGYSVSSGWEDAIELSAARFTASEQSYAQDVYRALDALAGNAVRSHYNYPYFVGWGPRSYYPSGYASSRVVSLPANTQDGDLLIFIHSHDDITAAQSLIPAGFTEIAESPMTSCGDTALTVAWKFASSEPAFISHGAPSGSPAPASGAILVALRNAHPTTPIAEVATACDTNTTDLTFPALTATGFAEHAVLWVAAKNNGDLTAAATGWGGAKFIPPMYRAFPQDDAITDTGWGMLLGTGILSEANKGNAVTRFLNPRSSDGVPCMSLLIQPPDA